MCTIMEILGIVAGVLIMLCLGENILSILSGGAIITKGELVLYE